MYEERQYVRHPTHLKIEVRSLTDYQLARKKYDLKNVALDGLGFQSDISWEEGSVVAIDIEVDPPVQLMGIIVRCKSYKTHFEIGIKLKVKNNTAEESYQIKQYQKMIANLIEDLYDTLGENIPFLPSV